MKIKPEHLAHLKEQLKLVDTPETRTAFMLCSNSSKGYRWFLVRKAGLMNYVCDTLYTYLNDDHIDTALRKLVKPLENSP